MAEQTIRVNVPDGYEIVAIDVPKAGIDYVLCGDDVIIAPPTVYSRVIVRKASENATFGDLRCASVVDLVDLCQRADQLRSKVMETWSPPQRLGGESQAVVAQTATMLTIAHIMGREFMGDLSRNQRRAIDSGLSLLAAYCHEAKA